MAGHRRLVLDIRPLRGSADFRRLWVGSSLSVVGGQMTTFAVTLQIYRTTHSSAAVGAVGLASGLPMILLGLFGGSFADAVDRRRLVLVTNIGSIVVSTLLAAQAFAGLRALWPLYTLVAVQALLGTVGAPARRTFVPRLLPAGQVAAGVALTQLSFQVGLMAGPALAGVVASAGGLRLCYLADVVSFTGTLYALARLPAMPPQGGPARPGIAAVADGLRFIRRRPILAGVFLADIDAMVLGMPFALFPALNAAHFGGAASTLGLITAAPGVGGLAGSALSGAVGHIARPGRALLASVTVWGAAIAGFGLARTLWLGLPLLVIAGAADTISVIVRSTIVQLATPDGFRGRVTGVDFVIGAAGPQVGNFRAGALASLTSPAVSAVGGGLTVLLGAGLLRLAVPALTRYTTAGDAALEQHRTAGTS
ncbi:MFS transporter [Actinoallomurus sp. CA-142502]|uniref:MFS transporter n=1 Tax=Actinoallomurus sp. CA-142502 TaxID=3239885 RepID=UPI003D8A9CFC